MKLINKIKQLFKSNWSVYRPIQVCYRRNNERSYLLMASINLQTGKFKFKQVNLGISLFSDTDLKLNAANEFTELRNLLNTGK